jgi:hypothetical protein
MDIIDLINKHGLNMDPMGVIKLRFDVTPSHSDVPLGLEVFLDDVSQFRSDHVQQKQTIEIALDDSLVQPHQIKICMWGKTWQHTQMDDQGTITQDAMLVVNHVIMDDIDITDLFYNLGIYYHNFNGNALLEYQVPFNGDIGCNGTVLFDFCTPYYPWLLEMM